MAKLAIVITDGVGFRNYILSDFIPAARKTFSEIIIYSCLPESAYEKFDVQCEIVELGLYTENFSGWTFRKSKEVAHLQLHKNDNFGIRDSLEINRNRSKNIRGYVTRMIFLLTKYYHSERNIQFYNKLQQWFLKKSPLSLSFRKQLQKDKPDLLFFTHQRPPFIAPLIYQAEKLGIRTAAFIFSWDNLASKGRMSGNFDYYLVWSELMQNELLQFYKSVNKERVYIVGTPQFEPYVLPRYKSDKATFVKKYNLDESLQVIVFTCNDSSSGNDPFYLDLIGRAVNVGILKANILVRTSPAETPERFLQLKEKYPFFKWDFPKWILTRENHAEPWSQRVPVFEDLVDFREMLEFCDVLINVLSTTILDAFLFDKPAICPIFGNTEAGYKDAFKFMDYGHLKNVVASDAVNIVMEESEFIPTINKVLRNPDARINEQKEFLKLEIGRPLPQTGLRIAKTLAALV